MTTEQRRAALFKACLAALKWMRSDPRVNPFLNPGEAGFEVMLILEEALKDVGPSAERG